MADAALPPIPRTPDANPAFEVRALFDDGLAQLRTLAARTWTDHNTHDPGITMLEAACQALVDLAYRHTLPLEDRLAGGGAAQFFAPAEVLPNRAFTALDWRRRLIDVDGVKNAWIEPVTDERLYADLRLRQLVRTPPAHPDWREVLLGGLMRVRVELMDSVGTVAERERVLADLRRAVETTRNLAEDVVDVRPVRAEFFALCAEVELDGGSSPTEAAAQLLFAVGEALAPPVRTATLAERLARGDTLPEVLDGPLPTAGFVDDADLQASALRPEIHLSDLMRAAAAVPGIRALRAFTLNPVARADEDAPDAEAAPDPDPSAVVGDAVPVANPWRIPVRAGRLPRLSLAQGRLVFSQRGLPVAGWNTAAMPTPVAGRLAELRAQARAAAESPKPLDLPAPPQGRPRALAEWSTLQHDLPAVYGIGPQGLPARASARRRAQALQLQGWLLFFDQLMADQLALLAVAHERLSVAPAALEAVAGRFGPGAPQRPHVLATQPVAELAAGGRLYAPEATPQALLDAAESADEAAARQQRLLDHLLARIAEDFADDTGALAAASGAPAGQVIGDKARFLKDAAPAVAGRAGAMDQRPPDAGGVWNTLNVSGLERRVAGLLGIADWSRRNLGLTSHDLYDEVDAVPDAADEYRFRVRHAVTHTILLSGSTRYPTPEAARAEMVAAIARAQRLDGYQRKTTADGTQHYFNIVDDTGEVIARRIQYFASAEAMEAAIGETLAYLRSHYSGEGLYLVEHILLRPREDGDPLLPICTDPGCADCVDVDPYSHRVHVLLPAYAGRFQDEGFRRFAERTIRREMPVHVLPVVCWIGSEDMARFESAWRDWLLLAAGFAETGRREKLQALIDALVGVKNVYPVRALFDCTGDETQPPFILGKTSLGRGPAG